MLTVQNSTSTVVWQRAASAGPASYHRKDAVLPVKADGKRTERWIGDGERMETAISDDESVFSSANFCSQAVLFRSSEQHVQGYDSLAYLKCLPFMNGLARAKMLV